MHTPTVETCLLIFSPTQHLVGKLAKYMLHIEISLHNYCGKVCQTKENSALARSYQELILRVFVSLGKDQSLAVLVTPNA